MGRSVYIYIYFFEPLFLEGGGKNTGVGCHSLLQEIFSQPRDWTQVSHIVGRRFTIWATRETGKLAQMVKHRPTMQETQVRSLGWEDLLEKETAPHSSTLAWKISWTEEPGRLQSMGSQKVRHNWATSLSLSLSMCVNPKLWIYPSPQLYFFIHYPPPTHPVPVFQCNVHNLTVSKHPHSDQRQHP